MNRAPALSARRRGLGFVLAVVLPATLTAVLIPLREPLNLVSDAIVFLGVTIVVALVGGLAPALLYSLLGSAALHYFFTPPVHTWAIDDPNNVLMLLVFAGVAAGVSSVVDAAARGRRRLDQEAARAAALAETDRLRTALLQAVSHDLRAPLTAAKTSVSAMLGTELSAADRHSLLAGADRSLDRLTSLVSNLLDLSRLQAGALPIQLQPTDIEEVVASALKHVSDEPDRVAVQFDELPAVVADPGLLERVVANLVGNALQHTTAGTKVWAVLDGDVVRLLIRDHGPGVAPEQEDRLYVPFQHSGDSDPGGGPGLGLALSKGLTEAMGGTLQARSTPGGGLTMIVTLEVAR
ncbi:MAG TPA: ATP-binding protein [Aeromicrobium sp.]|nr:ATP-binding protein [Aeromicrobium sp.]HKY58389.1 ATP-binding protein [Aeromicrobium sp.]